MHRPALSPPILLACSISMLSMLSASADFISLTDPSFIGVDNITLDTDTDLEWLDWSSSLGFSHNEMLDELDTGRAFEGWRYASINEVETMLRNMGLSVSSFFPNGQTAIDDGGESYDFAAELLGGPTLIEGNSSFTWAITNEPLLASRVMRTVLLGRVTRDGQTQSQTSLGVGATLTTTYQGAGHTLVRPASVPEPNQMLTIGAFVIFLTTRRNLQLRSHSIAG